MSKIGLIATYQELAEQGQEVAREIGIELLIEKATLDNAIPLAEKLRDKGCQVIVSRGGFYKKLEKAQLGIPIIGIRFTGYDMIRTLQEDIDSIGKNIALIVYDDMVYDVRKIGSILNVKVKEYHLSTEEDKLITVIRAVNEGADVIISGASVVKLAESLGIPTYLVKSGKESIWLALNEAREVAEIRRREQERANQLQAILDFAYEGIIAVDIQGKINIFNSGAEKALGLSAEEAIGRFGNEIIPEFAIDKMLANGQREVGSLVKQGAKQHVANKIPIICLLHNGNGQSCK